MPQFLYHPDLYIAENELAFFLARLAKSKVEAIPWKTDNLKHKQPDAVINACVHPVTILTGPPGTGKTTTLKQIVKSFLGSGLRGICISPTGKAAKRADEVINADLDFIDRIPCSTAHAALQFEPQCGGFVFNRTNRWRHDFVIIDEFPMAGTMIARDIMEAIQPNKTRLILSGDQHQLPSVDSGNFGRDIINSEIIPTVELDTVLRTGPNSGITYNCNRILRGQELSKHDPITNELFTDFFFVPRQDEATTVKTVTNWITKDIPEKRKLNSLTDIQYMAPGKNALCGTKNMNKILRDILNITHKASEIQGFKKGDKVINNTNFKNLNLVNGDIGFVKEVVNGSSGSHLTIDFGPNTGPKQDGMVDMKGELLDQLAFAYALTVHKCQGSEFPVAIFPTHRCHLRLMLKNLIYTGLSRAKALGLVVGDPSALSYGIKNNSTERRITGLEAALRREFKMAA